MYHFIDASSLYSMLLSLEEFAEMLASFFMMIASIGSSQNWQVSFQVADALEQPFPDGQFDLVWSMESGEHMPDKTRVPIYIYWFSL